MCLASEIRNSVYNGYYVDDSRETSKLSIQTVMRIIPLTAHIGKSQIRNWQSLCTSEGIRIRDLSWYYTKKLDSSKCCDRWALMVELLLWKEFSQLLSRCNGQHVHPSIFGTYRIFNLQNFQILNFGFEYLRFEILSSSFLTILAIEKI